MKRLTPLTAAAAAALVAGAALAVEPTPGASLGTTVQDISAALSEDGYEMTRYERERNRIEVYAVRGDVRHEIYVDARTGEVMRVETAGRRGPSPLPGPAERDIRAALAEQGYEVTGFERERGELEVYAVKDGRRLELTLDPRTGDILRIEADE